MSVRVQTIGELTLLGGFDDYPFGDTVLNLEPSAVVVEDALATRRVFNDNGSLTGAVYRADGSVVPETIRDVAVNRHVHLLEASPDRGTRRIEAADAIYLGSMMRHFGHFLLESLSRFWIVDQYPAAPVYLHPWRGFKKATPGFWQDTIDLLAGRPVELQLILRPQRFERLIIPRATYDIGKGGGSIAFGAWCQNLAERAAPDAGPARRKVYYSRSKLSDRKRGLDQEPELEAFFEARGFEIVHPQDLSFFEQIALMRETAVLAGTSGSALHQALFLRPGATVISLDYRLPRNQVAVEQITGVRAIHIKCLDAPDGWNVSFDREMRPVIDGVLGDLG